MTDRQACNGASLEMEPDASLLSPWFDTVPFALLLVDEDLSILHGNAQARKLFHCEREHHAGRLTRFLSSPDDTARLQQAHQEAMRGREIRCECNIRSWNGIEHSVRLTFKGLAACVGPCMVTVEDMADRMHSAEELLHLQRLSVVGRIACGFGHDLANLMMVVVHKMGKIGHLFEQHDEIARQLEDTVRAANTAQELARRMVSLGRRKRPTTREVDVIEAVRNAMSLLRGAIGKRIETSISCPAEPVFIRCDPVQLEQVLLNLVLNAREAIPEDGLVEARVELREAREGIRRGRTNRTPRHVSLTIEDDGCGMTEEVQERIFDPFYTTKHGGSGMGLTVVKREVDEMGGVMQVRSQLGSGTAMELLLPVLEGPAQRETEEPVR